MGCCVWWCCWSTEGQEAVKTGPIPRRAVSERIQLETKVELRRLRVGEESELITSFLSLIRRRSPYLQSRSNCQPLDGTEGERHRETQRERERIGWLFQTHCNVNGLLAAWFYSYCHFILFILDYINFPKLYLLLPVLCVLIRKKNRYVIFMVVDSKWIIVLWCVQLSPTYQCDLYLWQQQPQGL